MSTLTRGLTGQIMDLLKITDEALAQRVETEMSQHLRFSECTRREFNKEARLALETVRWIDSFNGDPEAMKKALAEMVLAP